jgi:hypothetical protein
VCPYFSLYSFSILSFQCHAFYSRIFPRVRYFNIFFVSPISVYRLQLCPFFPNSDFSKQPFPFSLRHSHLFALGARRFDPFITLSTVSRLRLMALSRIVRELVSLILSPPNYTASCLIATFLRTSKLTNIDIIFFMKIVLLNLLASEFYI